MYATTNSAIAATRNSVPPALISSYGRNSASGPESDALNRLGTTARYENNRTIYYESDEADYYYKVRSGTVRLCKVTEDGRRQIAAFLVPGDLFGWADGDAYNFSAEAVSNVTVEKYPRRRVEETVKADPNMGRHVLAFLSSQLTSAHDHLLLLGRMTAAERIAAFLLALAGRQRRVAGDGAAIELPMNRRDIADYLGLTVETVSRTMSEMKRKGIISFTEPEHIRLNQSSTLERMAMAA